jgi:hypothetical protein
VVKLNQELGEEVISAEDRYTDRTERCGQKNFPFGNGGSERLARAVMDSQPVACVDRILLALLEVNT